VQVAANESLHTGAEAQARFRQGTQILARL
jgi:hypothetical protein